VSGDALTVRLPNGIYFLRIPAARLSGGFEVIGADLETRLG
jgi:hypothetical protein